MFYIIQENLFKERHYDMLIENFTRWGLNYQVVKFVPYIDEVRVQDGDWIPTGEVGEIPATVPFYTDEKNVFTFGSVRFANTASKYGWYPGSLYNDNHDLEVYGKHYGENMLNHDGRVIRVTDPLPFDNFVFFARPTKDTKAFSGGVFTQDSWREWQENVVKSGTGRILNEETLALVAPLKEIYQEIRCWVVKGKVITISQYKLGNYVTYKNLDFEDPEAWEFAQKMVDIYQPAEAFVLDICRTENGFKVLEINCINAAGFYDLNMQKLIQALEDAFSVPNDKFSYLNIEPDGYFG